MNNCIKNIFLLSNLEITKLSHTNVIFIFKNFYLTLITLKLTSFLTSLNRITLINRAVLLLWINS